ncbi:hypothetical protein H0X06_05945 [Candidatus Dependentiae bacterium]|nr:hypothetical protein [Candidatus Dependentiae bacterium]
MAWYIISIALATGCNFMLIGFLLSYFPTTVHYIKITTGIVVSSFFLELGQKLFSR